MVLTSCGAAPTDNNVGKPLDKKNATEVVAAKDMSKLPESAKSRKDTLIVGSTAPSGNFAPITSSTVYDGYVASLVFDGLVTNDETGKIIPNVCEKWTISPDGKVYTFNLKKGIKFSTGEELTANDVKFTYTTIADPSYDGSRMDCVSDLEGYDEYNKGKATEVTGLKVVDPYTISFTYKNVNASAIANNFGYGVMPAKYYAFEKGNFKKVKDLDTKPVGCGAYTLTNYKAGQEVDFVRNDNYFKGAAKIKNIIMKTTTADTAIQQLTAGETDLDLVKANPETKVMLENSGFVGMQMFPSLGYFYMGWNLKNPMFADKNVRQALTYGFNRKKFVDDYYKGYGQVCNEPQALVSWAYTDGLQNYDFDTAKANKMLDDAGWAKGSDGIRAKDGKKFQVHLSGGSSRKGLFDVMFPILKDNWKAIGVEASLDLMEFGALSDKVYKRQDYEAFVMGWSLSIDPDPSGIFDFSQDIPGGFNAVHWRNDNAQKLLKDGVAAVDQAKRKDIYDQWNKIANDDLPYMFLSQTKDMWGVNGRVNKLAISPFCDWTYHINTVELAN